MHEEEVNQYLEQALKADQIINEQQLGWQWRAADLEIVRNPLLMGADEDGDGKYTLEEMQQHQKELDEEEEAKKVRPTPAPTPTPTTTYTKARTHPPY
jgi:hypothetical protein